MKHPFDNTPTLSLKIALATLVLVIAAPLLGLLYYSHQHQVALELERAVSDARAVAHASAEGVNDRITDALATLEGISASVGARTDRSECAYLMPYPARFARHFVDAIVLNAAGERICSIRQHDLSATLVKAIDWHREFAQTPTDHIVVSPPLAYADGVQTVVVARALNDRSGFVAVALNLESLGVLLERFTLNLRIGRPSAESTGPHHPDSTSARLVSRSGHLIAGGVKHSSVALQPVEASLDLRRADEGAAQVTEVTRFDDWLISVSLASDLIRHEAARASRNQTNLIALVVVLALLLASPVARRIDRPVRALAQDMRAMVAAHDGPPIPDSGIAEVAELSAAFAALVDARDLAHARIEDLAHLVERTSDMILVCDQTDRLTFMNDAARRALGVAPTSALDTFGIADFYPSGLDLNLARQVALIKGVWRGERELRGPVGRSIAVSSVLIARRDQHGRLLGFASISRDISAAKIAERRLRESEQRYQDLYDNGPDMLLSIDPLTRRVVQCNQTLLRQTGYSRDQVIGRELFSLYAPDSVAAAQRAYAQFAQRGEVRDVELRVICADGRVMDVSLSVTLLQGADGRPVYSRSSWRDIGARKRAEAQLRLRSEALEHSLNGFYIVDPVGRIRYANRAFITMFGFIGWDQLCEIRIGELCTSSSVVARIMRETEAAGATHVEFTGRRRDGSTFDGLAYIRAFHDEHGERLLIGTTLDITHRKRGEQERLRMEAELRQAQKLEAIGRLAGGIAHDFNNMLTVISGHCDVAREAIESAGELNGHLREIARTSEGARAIVEQLLAFARKDRAELLPIDLNASISERLSTLQQLAGDRMMVEFRPGKHLWPISMSHAQLAQVLSNLTCNARAAIAKRGTFTIRTANIGPDDPLRAILPQLQIAPFVLLEIGDSGAGMAPEVLERAIEPFFTTKPIGQGIGLGLSIVHSIVGQNGGRLWIRSTPGAGTTITICLPRLERSSLPRQSAALTLEEA